MARNHEQAIAKFDELIASIREMLKEFEEGKTWFGGKTYDENATKEHMDYLRSQIELYEHQKNLLK